MKNNLLFGSYKDEVFELDWDEKFEIITFESSYDITFEEPLKLFIYNFDMSKYDEYLISGKILRSEKMDMLFRYVVEICNIAEYIKRIEQVFEYANDLINGPYSIYDTAYDRYPELRKQYALYPDSLNSVIEKSFEDFIDKYFKEFDFEKHCNYVCENFKGSIYFSSLDANVYDSFLKNGIVNTIKYKVEKAHINEPHIFLNRIEGICIGNEICFNLMPRLDMIEKIIDEADRIGYRCMFAFPPLQEDNVMYFKNIINILEKVFSQKDVMIEIICNDWGAIHFLRNFNFIHITVGTMLNKYLRDPRKLPIRVKSNFFADVQMKDFYESYNITSILHSIPENMEEFSVLNNYLMFPFVCYMSSEYCPLISTLVEKNVYRERPDGNCKKLCKQFVRMYPSHLQCIGIGKANFVWNGNFMSDVSLSEKVKSLSNRLIYLDII